MNAEDLARKALHDDYLARRKAVIAEKVAASPSGLICGHCGHPMAGHADGRLLCTHKCRKAGRTDLRQWHTRDREVMNIRSMGEHHLQAAIAYLERNGRTNGTGYSWLREERDRRGLTAPVTYAPPVLATYNMRCRVCGLLMREVRPPLEGLLCICCGHQDFKMDSSNACFEEAMVPEEVADIDDLPVALPTGGKRGIKLKGAF